VQGIVAAHGKRMIGWEEVEQARLLPTSVAQVWRSGNAGAAAVRTGAKLILSPSARIYLDMQYDSTTTPGLHWAGYVEVRDAYDWDPATLVPGVGEAEILGVEAPLWTETVTDVHAIEFMAFPRLPGLAEIGWSPATARHWEDYRLRLAAHGRRWSALGVNYHRSPQVDWEDGERR